MTTTITIVVTRVLPPPQNPRARTNAAGRLQKIGRRAYDHSDNHMSDRTYQHITKLPAEVLAKVVGFSGIAWRLSNEDGGMRRLGTIVNISQVSKTFKTIVNGMDANTHAKLLAESMLQDPIHACGEDQNPRKACKCLIRAIAKEDITVAKYMVGRTDMCNHLSTSSVLTSAATVGCADLVSHIITTYEVSQDDMGCALSQAALNGEVEVVQMLLNTPHNPARGDAQDNFPLFAAANYGHANVVRLLLNAPRHPARADARNDAALKLAAKKGHAEVMRALLDVPEHPARPSAPWLRAQLMIAEQRGQTEVAELLRERM